MPNLYSRILLGTDLGPQSLYIAHHAIQISLLCHAQLIILHVIEPIVTSPARFSEHEAKLHKATVNAEKSLKAFCQKLNVSEQLTLLKQGTPQDELLNTAEENHCDLIIVGSHGVGGYSHLLGSTAHYLLEHAPCNVLIVQVSHLKEDIQTTMPKDQFLWQQPFLLNSPTQYGSIQGFGEVVRKGPRLSKRPPGVPYKGGTRTRTSENDDKNEK